MFESEQFASINSIQSSNSVIVLKLQKRLHNNSAESELHSFVKISEEGPHKRPDQEDPERSSPVFLFVSSWIYEPRVRH